MLMTGAEAGCADIEQIRLDFAPRLAFEFQLYFARCGPPWFGPAIGRVHRDVAGMRVCLHLYKSSRASAGVIGSFP
jgi:hypothetical protein